MIYDFKNYKNSFSKFKDFKTPTSVFGSPNMPGVAELDFVEIACYAFVVYSVWVFMTLGARTVKKLGTKLTELCKTEVCIADLPDDIGLFPGHTS